MAGLLLRSSGLVTLSLFANEVGDQGATALAAVAQRCPGQLPSVPGCACRKRSVVLTLRAVLADLRNLRLARNQIGPEGIQQVSRVLGHSAAFDKVLGIRGC